MTGLPISAGLPVRGGASRPGVLRFAVTGAIVSTIFFILCWVAALLPIGPGPHMYLQLFTDADIGTGVALAQGLCWSVVFGALVGGLIALVYNLLGSLDRR